MRCSCRACGAYMVQEERGLASGCRCPVCAARCADCMGSVQEPLTSEALRARFALSPPPDATFPASGEAEADAPDAEEGLADWRKYL